MRRIARSLNPEKIMLFGSHAYGDPGPDSDVDLLVVLNSRTTPKDRYLTVCRLLRPRPFPVDLIVKTPREVETALKRGDPFLREIVDRGRVLYERS
ncbi:MAG: nucleotidyltransferase domain-containing protein [Chloroflexi bacterium]|nr:nucleotidyltransferase domain-containing protein [Chloroflexota bacterium]